jgi:hypothetical protein
MTELSHKMAMNGPPASSGDVLLIIVCFVVHISNLALLLSGRVALMYDAVVACCECMAKPTFAK